MPAPARNRGHRLAAYAPCSVDHMTAGLATCFGVAACLTVATALMLLLPARPREVRIWHRLRVASIRRWLTRSRAADEPLDVVGTTRMAARNLRWHFVMSALFTAQLGIAVGSHGAWWRPLALLLVVPCVAYVVGSVVQRQKIAIICARERAGRGARESA